MSNKRQIDKLLREAASLADADGPTQQLRMLAGLVAVQKQLAELVDGNAAAARNTGASWAQLGAALGVTRQAAAQRYQQSIRLF